MKRTSEKRRKGIRHLAVAGIIGTMFLTGCSGKSDLGGEAALAAPETTVINIGFVDTSGANILLGSEGIARDQGYFQEEFGKIGIEVNLVPMSGAGPAINEALASGSLDIGILGDVPAVNGKSHGIDTTAIAFSGLDNTVVLLAGPKSDIDAAADLRGKKVATQKGSYMHRLLVYILESEGLTLEDIEFVNMTAQDALAAIESGSVDATLVQPNDTTYRLLQEDGFKAVLYSRDHEGWAAGSVTEIRTEYLTAHPDAAAAFLTAILRANEYIQNNENALSDQWVTAGYAKESYDFAYPKHDNFSKVEGNTAVLDNARNTLQFLIDNDLADSEFDVDAWYDASYYEKALEAFANK